MNNSELEALRRLLFFSAPEAASLVGDVAEQTWRRWEAGTRAIPHDVQERLKMLATWRQQSIDTALSVIDHHHQGDQEIVLVWYDTVDDWASLAVREPQTFRPHQSAISEIFNLRQPNVRLVRFDAPAYAAWLKNRKDSESMRSQWAAISNDASQNVDR